MTRWAWSFGLSGALKTFPSGVVVGVWEKLGIKLKLSFSWGLGLAELDNICFGEMGMKEAIFNREATKNTLV